MSGDGGWCTVESEPGVFHQLIRDFGVKGLQIDELWSLDDESLAGLPPVHGLVFLFKWTGEKDERAVDENTLGKVFFAKQVIQNACATQAILSVLLNAEGLDIGEQLSQFKEFTADFPPDMKGLAIGNSDAIRDAHNSFARPEPLVPDDRETGEKDDAFHFISYVPVAGTLYELDGLKEGPIPLGECSTENWLSKVVPHIQERMARYAEQEVRFNIMALVTDRLEIVEAKMRSAQAVCAEASARMCGVGDGAAGQAAVDAAPECERPALACALACLQPVGDTDGLAGALAQAEAEAAALQGEMADEREKRSRWHADNVRRRHNYVPFLFNTLRLLAKRGQLGGLVERAKSLAAAKAQAAQQAQAK